MLRTVNLSSVDPLITETPFFRGNFLVGYFARIMSLGRGDTFAVAPRCPLFSCPARYDRRGHYASGLSICPSHFTCTTLSAALSKSYDFSTNDPVHVTKPTWCRCAPPILFWPIPPFNLFPRCCLTFSWLIFTEWYHFVCSAQQMQGLFNKLSFMCGNAHMM